MNNVKTYDPYGPEDSRLENERAVNSVSKPGVVKESTRRAVNSES